MCAPSKPYHCQGQCPGEEEKACATGKSIVLSKRGVFEGMARTWGLGR